MYDIRFPGRSPAGPKKIGDKKMNDEPLATLVYSDEKITALPGSLVLVADEAKGHALPLPDRYDLIASLPARLSSRFSVSTRNEFIGLSWHLGSGVWLVDADEGEFCIWFRLPTGDEEFPLPDVSASAESISRWLDAGAPCNRAALEDLQS